MKSKDKLVASWRRRRRRQQSRLQVGEAAAQSFLGAAKVIQFVSSPLSPLPSLSVGYRIVEHCLKFVQMWNRIGQASKRRCYLAGKVSFPFLSFTFLLLSFLSFAAGYFFTHSLLLFILYSFFSALLYCYCLKSHFGSARISQIINKCTTEGG